MQGSDTGIGRSHDLWTGVSQASQLVRRCNGRGRGGCRGLSRTMVDDPLYTHARVGMMRLGQEVSHPSMGWGWHAQIGAGLGRKGPRGSGVIQGVPQAMTRDGSQ